MIVIVKYKCRKCNKNCRKEINTKNKWKDLCKLCSEKDGQQSLFNVDKY